jgi:choline dehydrogenase
MPGARRLRNPVFQKLPEFNRGDNFGNAYFQMNQRRGKRWSATSAYLKPAMSRPNLHVVTNAQVEKLKLESQNGCQRATGVAVCLNGKETVQFNARREVLLSAGAIGSPQILQLSGIGPGELLQARGIEVKHELAGGWGKPSRSSAGSKRL